MTRSLALAACLTWLAACHAPESSTSVPPPARVASTAPAAPVPLPASAASAAATSLARDDGYGALRFGMDEAAVARAWGDALDGVAAPGTSCFYLTPAGAKTPADLAFMFEGGRFVRYDVATVQETAPGGGRVGMTAARIRALYAARVVERPHKYVAGARYLGVTGAGAGVLVFETDADGKVTRWRAGVPPQIDYVEGCA